MWLGAKGSGLRSDRPGSVDPSDANASRGSSGSQWPRDRQGPKQAEVGERHKFSNGGCSQSNVIEKEVDNPNVNATWQIGYHG